MAKARKTSVSAMLSRFVIGFEAMDQSVRNPPIGSLTLAATGLACGPANQVSLGLGATTDAQDDPRADEALLEDALWERYRPLE